MKIIKDDCIYIQKHDIQYIMQEIEMVPVSFFMSATKGNPFIVTDNNRFEFVKFTCEEDINFINSLEFILDFNSFDNMNEEELISQGMAYADEKNKYAEIHNEKLSKEEDSSDTYIQYCFANYKMYAIRDLLWSRKGEVEFIFPEESGSGSNKARQRKKSTILDKIKNKIKPTKI